MRFDVAKISELQSKLSEVMKSFAEENGLVAGTPRVKYSENDFQVQIQFGNRDENPNGIEPRFLRDLMRNGHLSGLDKTMVGTPLILETRSGCANYEFLGMHVSKAVCVNAGNRKNYYFDAPFIATQIKLQKRVFSE
jgi:hypothetical protein